MWMQILNLFKIRNLEGLNCKYRLLVIEGLPQDSSYNKNINLLAKNLAFELQNPVALVSRSGKSCLALPADCKDPRLDQPLTPHVATLSPIPGEHELTFTKLDPESTKIAVRFLEYSLRTPLMRQRQIWSPGPGKPYYWKYSVNESDLAREIDIYEGFSFRVVHLRDDKLYLAADIHYKYIDRKYLTSYLGENDLTDFAGRHFLYQFGHRWYQVQLVSDTGSSIKNQKFTDERDGNIYNVYDFTLANCSTPIPSYVKSLDSDSPAIIYQYLGSNRKRYGAVALCRLAYGTQDPKIKRLHSQSIRTPDARFREISEIIQKFFRNVQFNGVTLDIDSSPLKTRPKSFAIPDLLFGKGKILHVKRQHDDLGTEIKNLGRERMRYVLTNNTGPLVSTPFDRQYMLVPKSLPRSISDAFRDQFISEMQRLTPQDYSISRIVYDDSGATNLYRQVHAIQKAVSQADVRNGYALLVLPENSNPDLHNYIKQKLWQNIQCQCAMAGNIKEHFEISMKREGKNWELKPDLTGRFTSYTRYVALGMMIINKKWLWALDSELYYDVYVGIDVLNNMAGFTFVYKNGQYCYFRNYPSQQKEKLPSSQIYRVLVDHLKTDLRNLNLSPKSIILHRDGRIYESELEGYAKAMQKLNNDGILPEEILTGAVEIHKQSSLNLRLCSSDEEGKIVNPRFGSYFIMNSTNGIVCNTGWPFQFPGTVKPLQIVVASGNLDITYVLEDIFALSQLAWSSPDKCSRLPITIKLSDDFLEPIASSVELDEALYGSDEDIADEIPTEKGEGAVETTEVQ
jgi:hypothetical protein